MPEGEASAETFSAGNLPKDVKMILGSMFNKYAKMFKAHSQERLVETSCGVPLEVGLFDQSGNPPQ